MIGGRGDCQHPKRRRYQRRFRTRRYIVKISRRFLRWVKAEAQDVLLLIEVSDSTAKYDKTVTMKIYAEAEVAEVWLINLPRQILEVHLEPENGKYKVVKNTRKMNSSRRNFFPMSK